MATSSRSFFFNAKLRWHCFRFDGQGETLRDLGQPHRGASGRRPRGDAGLLPRGRGTEQLLHVPGHALPYLHGAGQLLAHGAGETPGKILFHPHRPAAASLQHREDRLTDEARRGDQLRGAHRGESTTLSIP